MSELDDLRRRVDALERVLGQAQDDADFHGDALRVLDSRGDELAAKINATHLGVIALNASVGVTQSAVGHVQQELDTLRTDVERLDASIGRLRTVQGRQGDTLDSVVGLLEEILRRLPRGSQP